jgi:hypothetical protein
MAYALGSAALTLGRARGAAWIGQPLELAVSAQLDAGQAANSLCAEADVFYADSKLDASRIQISVEAAAQPDTATIRIFTPALIDEPVVTVYVRAGCSAKTTRRYVLLADFPSENVSPPVRVAEPPPVPTVVPATTAAPEPKVNGTLAAATVTPAAPVPPKATTPRPAPSIKADIAPPSAREPAKLRKPATEPKAAKEPKAPSSSRARLKLDPIENLAERIKTLEATTTAQPLEDMVRDSQRIQELQSSVKALLDQAAKNEASLLAMRERMDRAESDRVPAWLVYALLAVVAACAAAIAVLWNRRDPSAWRSGLPAADNVAPARASRAAPIDNPELEDAGPSTLVQPPPARLKQQGRYLADPMDLGARPFESFVTVNAPVIASDSDIMAFSGDSNIFHPDFNTGKMFDLRQQAEFFTKLGKLDEAIEALEKRIRENSKDCPLIYLELLRVANQHSLKTDFRQFREEMTQVFNVNVPEFALFRDEGRGLETYPGVLDHITQLWPSTQVMNVIEACVLISPGEKNAARFDLAAFRELVMLHGLIHFQTYKGQDHDAEENMDSEHVSLDL